MADDPGFLVWKDEALIGKWSPELARTLAETGIGRLRLRSWNLRGVNPLAAFRKQIVRVFIECDVADLAALAELSALRHLYVRGTVEAVDFSRLEQLEQLSISGEAPKFGNLRAAPSLKRLKIIDCGLPNLAELSALKQLEELSVAEAPLKSLTGIEKLQSLRRLMLAQVPLGSLDGLQQLKELAELVLYDARRLSAIKEAALLPRLRKLSVDLCKKVADLVRIGDLGTLEQLELTSVALASVSFLSQLEGLRLLRLESVGRIPSLRFLRGMTALETLLLAENTIVENGDMSILLQLPALKTILYTERRHYKPRREEIRATLNARHGVVDEAG